MPDSFTSCQKTYAVPEESFQWLISCPCHNYLFTVYSHTDLGEQDALDIACPEKIDAELSDKLNDWF